MLYRVYLCTNEIFFQDEEMSKEGPELSDYLASNAEEIHQLKSALDLVTKEKLHLQVTHDQLQRSVDEETKRLVGSLRCCSMV